jgi:putative tricarboxylic transport membrane protein
LTLKLSKDGWAGLAVGAVSLFLFALTLGLKPSPLVPIGPGFYPRIVLGLSAFFGFALVVSDLLRPGSAPARGDGRKVNYAGVALHFALFAVYALLLPGLGFRVATFVYVAAANAAMAPPRSAHDWLRVGLLALGTTLVTYYVFEHYLSVLLPRGRWTDF